MYNSASFDKYRVISITIKETYIPFQTSLCCLAIHPLSQTPAPYSRWSAFDRLVLAFLEFHINWVKQQILFCVWLLILSIVIRRFIRGVCLMLPSFLPLSSVCCADTSQSICSSIGEHSNCFQFEAIVCTLPRMFIYKSLCGCAFISLG